MSVMNYVSSAIKIIAVKHSLVGTESLNQSAARFGVSRSTLQKWLLNYEMFGTEGLCHRAGNHHYSKEIKREAVEAYLPGRMSEEEICKKYQIRSRTQLEKWVSLYNGQKEFRPAGGARKGTCMARISGEEKEKAVEFCIAQGLRPDSRALRIYIPADLWVGAEVSRGGSQQSARGSGVLQRTFRLGH